MIVVRKLLNCIILLLPGIFFVTSAPPPSYADVILVPELVHSIFLDIAKYRKESQGGATEEIRLEALYQLGEKARYLTGLLNKDLRSHGVRLFAQLVVKRLQEYGIEITFAQRKMQYAYDLAAFHEYLRRSPRGDRSSDIRFQLISHTFYQSIGTDPAKLVNTDVAGVLTAVAEQEKFLKEYPDDKRVKKVRFFWAVNYYRLYRNSRNVAKANEYRTLARDALTNVMKRYPGTVEARGAEGLLETIQETWKGSRLQPTIPLVLAMKQSEEGWRPGLRFAFLGGSRPHSNVSASENASGSCLDVRTGHEQVSVIDTASHLAMAWIGIALAICFLGVYCSPIRWV